jgi:type III pantothenate kinase
MPQDQPSLLAVDIGNTQVVVGVFVGQGLIALYRLTSVPGRTADDLYPLLEPLLRPHVEGLRRSRRVAIASVVPSLTGPYEEFTKRYLEAHPILISATLPLDMVIDVVDPASIGADRIADAVAAAAMFRLPAIVVDLGTATTFDVVLPGPRYAGGVIAPGILTSAEELFRRAARLARVELRPPSRTVGKTTEESIQSGVLFGAAAQIDGIVGRISSELNIRPTVIATGGLAQVIAPLCRSLGHVEPGLTLHGIRLIDEKIRRQNSRLGLDRKPGSAPRPAGPPSSLPPGAARPAKKRLRSRSHPS